MNIYTNVLGEAMILAVVKALLEIGQRPENRTSKEFETVSSQCWCENYMPVINEFITETFEPANDEQLPTLAS